MGRKTGKDFTGHTSGDSFSSDGVERDGDIVVAPKLFIYS